MEKDLLMVVSKDYLYGINHGAYPELLADDVKRRVKFIVAEEINQSELPLHTSPSFDDKDIYIKDSHSNLYVKMDDNDIEELFIISQCTAVNEALVWMGAKSIRIKRTIKDVDKKETEVNGDAKYALVDGDVHVGWDNSKSINLEVFLSSEDLNCKPKSFEEVNTYINEHGLANNSFLMSLAGRLKDGGRISGKMEITVNLLSELKSSLHCAANLHAKLLNAHVDAKSKHEHIHEYRSVVEVDFGD